MSYPTSACLTSGNYLTTNQYISGPDLGFVIMQGDGDICWYWGTGPSDNQGLVHALSHPHGEGDYFLIMQEDGNLCAYRGTGPSDNQGLIFETGTNQSGGTGSYTFELGLYNPIPDSGPLPAVMVKTGGCGALGLLDTPLWYKNAGSL